MIFSGSSIEVFTLAVVSTELFFDAADDFPFPANIVFVITVKITIKKYSFFGCIV
jgi:hypothetical protein